MKDEGMFYYDRGSGQPLLLIHGMWGDHLDWEPVLEPLSERYRVIAVDLPGFGQSEADHIEYTAAFFTERLQRLLTRLGIDRVAVCGNSFGGQLAMSLALAAPALVTKLILVGTGGLRKFQPGEIEATLGLRSERVLRSLTPEINSFMFGKLFVEQGSETQRRYLEKQNARLKSAAYPQYVRIVNRCMRLAIDFYLLGRVKSIQAPVLLLQGDRDPVVPLEWARAAVPLFPKARLVVIDNCGHVPQIEQPARFVREVAAFL